MQSSGLSHLSTARRSSGLDVRSTLQSGMLPCCSERDEDTEPAGEHPLCPDGPTR